MSLSKQEIRDYMSFTEMTPEQMERANEELKNPDSELSLEIKSSQEFIRRFLDEGDMSWMDTDKLYAVMERDAEEPREKGRPGGRTSHTVDISATSVKEGSDLTIRVANGKPHSQVTVQIIHHGDMVHDFGSLQTNEDGDFRGDLKVPHRLIHEISVQDWVTAVEDYKIDVHVFHDSVRTTKHLLLKRVA